MYLYINAKLYQINLFEINTQLFERIESSKMNKTNYINI